MAHEYEFRLVVQHEKPFTIPHAETQHILYMKPHFRYKQGVLETKVVVKTEMVYQDGLWFKWVHSKETPYRRWKTRTHRKFLEVVSNFQCPFRKETRQVVTLDKHAQLYTFQVAPNLYRMVFEWEAHKLEPFPIMLRHLKRYRHIYQRFRSYANPLYTLTENLSRKPVKCIPELIHSPDYVAARKWDGIFGFVYSFPTHVMEKWEGGMRKKREGISLGDGIVYSAEKMEDHVILLDVYQVRGHSVAVGSRRNVLMEYLPSLQLPEGYRVQTYYEFAFEIPEEEEKTDGHILHDVDKDTIFKVKEQHSIDVVYRDEQFHIPGNHFQCLEDKTTMVEGHVYEVSLETGRVIRERTDRMTGNTVEQINNILKNAKWNGPRFKKTEKIKIKKRKRKG